MISIVTPVYNEEGNVVYFHDEVTKVMQTLDMDYEIIYVNDGSKDRTDELIHQLAAGDPHVRALTFARNFGHQIAITCGMDFAIGDAVITMDGDMQHPPELIPALLKYWHEGYDVVQTIRDATRDASWVKRTTSGGYYKFLNLISEVPVQPGGSDFRLMDRKAVLAFRRYREHARFIRGLIGAMGFRQKQLHFTAPPRFAGSSKFSPRKMWRLAVDGVFTCSTFPLRLGLYFGMASLFASGCVFLHVLYETFVSEDTTAGWPTIMACLLFFGGMQLLILGIIGEYLGRTYEETKRRPLYLLERGKPEDLAHGLDDTVAAEAIAMANDSAEEPEAAHES